MRLGYNITSTANLLGFRRLMELMGGAASQALTWLRHILGIFWRVWRLVAERRRRALLPAGICFRTACVNSVPAFLLGGIARLALTSGS